MASGPEHYSEAERLVTEQEMIPLNNDDTCPEADRMLAEAKVHAILALAAATAMQPSAFSRNAPEYREWHEAAGVKRADRDPGEQQNSTPTGYTAGTLICRLHAPMADPSCSDCRAGV